jgi:hypothetical protein
MAYFQTGRPPDSCPAPVDALKIAVRFERGMPLEFISIQRSTSPEYPNSTLKSKRTL